jgi:hypothetical protein
MASRKEARAALADDLRTLADDLKALVEDPKERKKKERLWRLLYGGVALGFTVVSRRLVTRAWAILTGEQPPAKGQPAQPAPQEREREREREPAAT